MNTFGSYMIVTLALPLYLTWPYAKELVIFTFTKAKDLYPGVGGQAGEFSLSENHEQFDTQLNKTFLGYLIFFIARVS